MLYIKRLHRHRAQVREHAIIYPETIKRAIQSASDQRIRFDRSV